MARIVGITVNNKYYVECRDNLYAVETIRNNILISMVNLETNCSVYVNRYTSKIKDECYVERKAKQIATHLERWI